MPDYGQYRLDNSTAIPKTPGQPLSELQQLFSQKQQQYQTAIQATEAMEDMRDSSMALPGSQDTFRKMNDEAFKQAGEIGKDGALEDHAQELVQQARRYKRNLQPFIAEYTAFQKFQDDLTKNDKITDPAVKAYYINKALGEHKGVQKDPTTGAYIPNFHAPAVVNDVDIPKKIDGWVKDIAEKEFKTKVRNLQRSSDGIYWVETANGRKQVTPDMVDRAVQSGMELDPEVKPYIQREMDRATYGVNFNNIHPDQVTDEKMQRTVSDFRDQGYSFPQALKLAMQKGVQDHFLGNIKAYSQKVVKDNWESEHQLYDSEEGKEFIKGKYAPETVVGPGAAIKLDLPSKDPKTLNDTMSGIINQQDALGKQITQWQNEYNHEPDQKRRAALAQDIQTAKNQIQSLDQHRTNLGAVGANIRNGMINDDNFKVVRPEIDQSNQKLKSFGILPQHNARTGEDYEPYEIARTARLENGRVVFSTYDGRRIVTSLGSKEFNKIQDFNKSTEAVHVGDGFEAPDAMSPFQTQTNAGYSGVERTIRDMQDKQYQNESNFQYTPQVAGFQEGDRNHSTMNNFLKTNPTMNITASDGTVVSDPAKVLNKGHAEITGLMVDPVMGKTAQEGTFVMRVNTAGANKPPVYEYYNAQFPGSSVGSSIRNNLVNSHDKVQQEIGSRWTNAQSLDLTDQDFRTMGQSLDIPNSDLRVRKTSVHNGAGKSGTSIFGVTKMVNGHEEPVKDPVSGRPIMYPENEIPTLMYHLKLLKDANQ